ncbi:hypothetical protein [Actinomadura monticuli]|uniref:TolB-like translocation protein n=1 Tax=Actinomadura monticuli TaxID=3097367 RepID=A0ABV4Q8V4_9ACTN
MTNRSRATMLIVAAVLLAGLAVGYTVHAATRSGSDRSGAGRTNGRLSLSGHGRILFRDTGMGTGKDHLASVTAADPGGRRIDGRLSCVRFYAAAGTGVCLRNDGGVVPTYTAVILDGDLTEVRRIELAGTPSRARVSPSGHMAAWTVFVSGDSYGSLAFSTRASILDVRTGTLVPSLETFSVAKDGKPYRAADVNFWGVTFADDDRFYATLATAGRTYLVEGSVRGRSVRTLRENLECPSLSPDGTRLVFKKRVRPASSGAPWRLYALDLKTMRETPLAEQRSVDDQATWFGPDTVVYALAGDFGTDLWSVPADGTGTPKKIISRALSPAMIP